MRKKTFCEEYRLARAAQARMLGTLLAPTTIPMARLQEYRRVS